jgi:hypothetical protein
VLVSCAREWEPEEAFPEEGLVERTWTVSMSDGTRAALDESLRPVWEAGEELSVYDHVAGVGRIFKVQSVDGFKATITGKISEGGDTPFDAVYPACSAGEWVSDGTGVSCPLKLPETQLIPKGRNVCPDVLVSTAHSDLPEGVIAFHNISSLLKVIVDSEGITDISLDLLGSGEEEVRSYRAAPATGTLAKGTYYVAVDPGTYGGGLNASCSDRFGQEYRRSSTTPLEANASGMLSLGKVSVWDPWRYYKIDEKKTKVYDRPIKLLNETAIAGNVSSVVLNLMIYYYLPGSNYNVEAITYTYRSADPQGDPVDLSAVLYIPQHALKQNKSLTGVAIANHGTITSYAECPTNKTQAEGAFAWKNYAIIMPDYYGFGVSVDRPQAFLDPETTARGNIDALLAAEQLMIDKGVTIPETFYNAGYSQGGFNAMANLKYVAQHPELGIAFDKTMCGGSPFDIALTWRKYLQEDFGRAIGFVPLTVVSMNESQNLGLSYSDLFKGELLAKWRDWILSKEYNISTINSLLGTTSLSDVMNENFMAGTGNAYDTIMSTCVNFSLTSGWIPPEETEIILYHSKNDDTVPYENQAAMMSFLDSAHHGKHTSSGDDDGGHVEAIVSFITTILNKW